MQLRLPLGIFRDATGGTDAGGATDESPELADPDPVPKDLRARTIGLAQGLLVSEGLTDWTVVINPRMSSRFGLCKYDEKEIHLARWLVDEAPWSETEDTIRHEVAHAAVGHKHGHDRVWVEAVQRLGARAVRRGSGRVWEDHSPAASRPAKWLVICDACGLRFLRRRRDRDPMIHETCGTPVRWEVNPDWAV